MRHKALDGWRGIGAVMILMFHLGPIQSPLFIHGYMFVDFFLILSGYVIEGAYENRITDLSAAKTFLWRRLIRLYPLHLLVLSVMVGLTALVNSGVSVLNPAFLRMNTLGTLTTNLLMLHGMGFHKALSWNWPSWTISSEFFVYVAYVGMKTSLPRAVMVYVAAGVAALGLVFLFIVSDHGIDISFDYGFIRCLMDFLIGLCLRHAAGAVKVPSQFATLAEGLSVVSIGLLFWFGGWNKLDFAAPFVFSALIVIFAGDGGALSKLLISAPIQWLGERSYAFYIVHLPVVLLYFTAADWVVAAYGWQDAYVGLVKAAIMIAVVAPVVTLFSHLLFTYVERPAAKVLG